jgi:predicted Na+-dependent transporter
MEQRRVFMHDLALRIFLRSTGLVNWIQDNVLLWSNLVALAAAYLNPVLGAHSQIVLPYVVAVLFVLCGAMVPFSELRGGVMRVPTHLIAMVFTFCIVPLVMYGVVSAVKIPFSQGLLIASAMPPPLLSLTVMTLHARGSESLAMTYSAIGNGIGLVVTPLIIRMAVPEHATAFRPFLLHYLLFLVLPLVVGCLLQRLCSHRKAVTALRPLVPARLEGLLIRGDHEHNEHWCRHPLLRFLVHTLLLVLNYFTFCSTFMYLKDAVAFKEVMAVCGVVFLFHIVALYAGWLLSMVPALKLTPEDRIAFVFMCCHKTDTLSVPYVAQLYATSTDSALLGKLTVPVLCHYAVQTIFGAALVFALKRWRDREHCGSGYAPVSLHHIFLTDREKV